MDERVLSSTTARRHQAAMGVENKAGVDLWVLKLLHPVPMHGKPPLKLLVHDLPMPLADLDRVDVGPLLEPPLVLQNVDVVAAHLPLAHSTVRSECPVLQAITPTLHHERQFSEEEERHQLRRTSSIASHHARPYTHTRTARRSDPVRTRTALFSTCNPSPSPISWSRRQSHHLCRIGRRFGSAMWYLRYTLGRFRRDF